MWRARHRLGFVSGLLALGMSACSVFISTNVRKVRFVQLTPANPTIAVGDVQQFTVNVTYSDGVVTEPNPVSAIWASSDSSVALISSQGQATALAAGTSVITATYKGVSGSTVLTVTAPSNVSIRVSGSATTLNVTFLKTGRSFSYTANAADDTIGVSSVTGPRRENRLEGVVSVIPGRGPGWLAISPSGRFLYVANRGSQNISVFLIDPASGRLADVPGSPFDAGGSVWSVAVNPGGRFLSATDFRNSSVVRLPIRAGWGGLEPLK